MSVVAVAAGACVSEVEVEVEPPDYTTLGAPQPDPDTCPTNMCGDGNSPVIAGIYFWRLSLAGEPNPEGVRIVGVHKEGIPLKLEVVDGDRLRATDLSSAPPLEHEQLRGVVIRVSVPGPEGPADYDIEISRVMPNTSPNPVEQFWAPPYLGIEAYDFMYRPVGVPVRIPLCSDAAKDLPLINQDELRAVVFDRERYNPATKEITPLTEISNWFNIACVNSAPYKMHKIGYTLAARPKPGMPQTSPEQRRAMLNAWTANVCGDGTSYTQPGIPIRLREKYVTLPSTSSYYDPFKQNRIAAFEALWTEEGAVCLDSHRLDPLPGGAGEILCRMSKPSCADWIDGRDEWMQHGYVATAVPPPPPQPPPPDEP